MKDGEAGSARHEELQRIFTRAARLEPGERAAFLDQACAGAPELLAEVSELLAADAEKDGTLEDGEGVELLVGLLAGDREPDAGPASIPERIGKYRILRVIGQGGMGVVYEAEEDHPRRRVALKVVRSWMVTDELSSRFRHEARVLGRLQHPGIAQIYEAGTAETGAGRQPYFAMELVEGEPLDRYARSRDLDLASRLELVARLCDVLHYAHEKGVVHRDLKPANILVSQVGSRGGSATDQAFAGWPKVLDFGVARATGADLHAVTLQTTEGQLVGTVPYMSPEQAAGDPTAIDRRSDVYAVGVIAYELLAGRPPYEVHGRRIHDAVRIIQEEEPSSLGGIDRALRGDVETIVAKALEKEKHRRYASAGLLAADLRRHLRHEPIEARAASALYQVRKFARRHKTLVGGVLATLLVAIAGAAVATSFAFEATRRAADLEHAIYGAGLAAASGALDQQDHAAAEAQLDRLPAHLRGWESAYLRARLLQHVDEWELPSPLASRPVFAPDGERVHAILEDGSVASWEASGGRLLERSDIEGIAELVRESAANLALHAPTLRYAALAADGDLLVGSLAGGPPTRFSPLGPGGCTGVHAWDAEGRELLLRGEGTFVWDGERARRLAPQASFRAEFSPAGDRVAMAAGGLVRLVDSETGAELARRRLADNVLDLRFAPEGTTLAVAGAYRNAFLLDGHTLEVAELLTGHLDRLDGLAWSADGAFLVTTSSSDGSLRVWDRNRGWRPRVFSLDRRPGAARVSVDPEALASVTTITPDGAHVLVGGERLLRFPLDDPYVLRGHDTYVYRLAFSPDGSLLASSGYQKGDVMLWDVPRARAVARLAGPAPRAWSGFSAAAEVAFTADGRQLVAASPHGTARWDARTGAALPAPATTEDGAERYFAALGRRAWGAAQGMALSPDGRWFANCRGDEGVALHALPPEVARGTLQALPPGQFRSTAPANYAWRREPDAVLAGHGGATFCVAFSPDGTRIATGGNDATIRIWDAERHEQLLVLRGHQQYVKDLEFSPDGSLLASASGDTTVRLWDTRPLYERRALGRAAAARR